MELSGFYNMGTKTTYKMTYKNGANIREHRAVMEKHIGRSLRTDEIIHHKDGNKRNNAVSNLEIVTRSNHARLHSDRLLKRKRPITQKDKDGTIIKIWESGLSIKRELGYENSNICKCCNKIIKTCYGYTWEYSDVRT